VIGVPEADTHIYFSLTCVTAPVFGAILSGIIASKFGGYKSKYALPSCIGAASIVVVAAIIVPMIDDFKYLIMLIWTMLFCGGFVLPILTGVMLNEVENNVRPQANSIANLCYNLFGYFPAPAIYGTICSFTGGRKSKWGMVMLMYMTIPSFLFLLAAWVSKKKQTNKKLNIINNKNKSNVELV